MKDIYHITENISNSSGGVRTILKLLHENLVNNKINSKIITTCKEPEDAFTEFKSDKAWYYNTHIKSHLKTLSDNAIFHLHGVYTYNQYVASEIAKKKNIPYLITPHGMLEPWILEKNPIKKGLYLKLILNNILEKATVLHAITPLEKENLFKLTKHRNIVEIPNLIDFNNIPKNLNYNPKEDYFVFVGRIDSKKGIEIIIEALKIINNSNIKLKIIGVENKYSEYLKELIKKRDLVNNIDFLGGIFGDEKYDLIANARALLAPSYSEAIGMVNLEAAACKTPVITTFQTGLKKEWGGNGGILINPNVSELKNAIIESYNWNNSERIERGKNLYEFTQNNYSWDKKAWLWHELYESL